MNKGMVYILGAGPGDPGLLTIKGLEKLKLADVVVYDRLINNELLNYCKTDCEKIFVGKEAGFHLVEQNRITGILINKSNLGLTVVRLKGGNPFVYGRGSEEAIALRKAEIDFEIIPGITSGLAAPIYSGIPITHRGLVSQCIFITGHESTDGLETQVEWDKLAKLKYTSLIIYMGATRIELISETLMKHGMNPETPVAVIENGTLSNQKTITSNLNNISDTFKQNNLRSPCIIIISPTVPLREEISWWEKKALYNKRIVIVGTEYQSKDLRAQLYDSGAEILLLPVMKVEIKVPNITLKELLSHNVFEWILFTSVEGVKYYFKLLNKEDLDARIFKGMKIGTFGFETTKELNAFGLKSDFSQDIATPELIVQNFSDKFLIEDIKFLVIEGESQHNLLSTELNKFGGKVKTLKSYKFSNSKPEQENIINIQKNKNDAFVFLNSATVDRFFEILGSETATKLLNNSISIVLDPLTSNVLINKSIRNVIECKKVSIDAIYEKIFKSLCK
ncbi:uroporphyrinogen-III C-methyltransferase [Bacteroidota bacterium]